MSAAITTGVAAMFKKVLTWGGLLIAGIAVIAGVLGWIFAGSNGLVSALIGAAIAFAFVSLTALSVWAGGKLNLGGFYGVVLGGWIVKVVVFLIIVGVLRHASFINGPTLFFTLVASILGSLGIDSWVFLKARLPIEPK
ncbi:MAG: hypothetical protein RJA35_970 [Actinomycetota bacterium]|jgi:hypothetical protein